MENRTDEMLLDLIEQGALNWPNRKQLNLLDQMSEIEVGINRLDDAKDLLDNILEPMYDSKDLVMISKSQVNALHSVVSHLTYLSKDLRSSFDDAWNAACKEKKKD